MVTGRPLPRTSIRTRQGRSRFTRGDTPARRDSQRALLAHPALRVDLCLAQPDKGGLILLVCTGNAAFGAGVLARWKRRTRQCLGAGGQQRGQENAVREPPDKATIRGLLGLPFTPPEQRQGGLL